MLKCQILLLYGQGFLGELGETCCLYSKGFGVPEQLSVYSQNPSPVSLILAAITAH
jgi:hypothetical protein